MRSLLQQGLSGKSALLICRIALAGIFLTAAIGKISRPQEFADAVTAFRLLPVPSVNILAIILPWVEVSAAVALLHGATARSGALTIAVLNVVFLVAVGSAIIRGLDIECGCFTLSHAHTRIGWTLLGRDAILLVLCLPIVCSSSPLPETIRT